MRGATANSISSASSMPSTTANSVARARPAPATAAPLVASSSATPHATDSQVCAVNSLAAMLPARAGVGRNLNSSGTAMKPIAVRLPHHRALAKVTMRAFSMATAPVRRSGRR